MQTGLFRVGAMVGAETIIVQEQFLCSGLSIKPDIFDDGGKIVINLEKKRKKVYGDYFT